MNCGLIALAAAALLGGCKQNQKNDGDVKQADVKKISETMGFYVVENLNAQNVVIDLDSLIRGIENAKAGKTPPLTKEEFAQIFMEYRKQAFDTKSTENLKTAEKFLSENSQDSEVLTLENGKLQYKILQKGSGEEVNEDNTPLIHYEGKFVDGKVFDSTQSRGAPVPISLKTTIPGFKMGLSGMKQGEKRRLFIHPDLGYGTAGRLPPNSLLIFDIEVVEAEAKKQDEKKEEDKETKESSFSWLKKWTGG